MIHYGCRGAQALLFVSKSVLFCVCPPLDKVDKLHRAAPICVIQRQLVSNFDSANSEAALRCPHCGELITTMQISQFQVYEIRVASWLKGKLPPVMEPDFDVWKCEPFPDLTFQVKYSKLNKPKYSKHQNGCRIWSWSQKRTRDDAPDYYILCGIYDDGKEDWFVMSRRAFIEHSSKTKDGGRFFAGNSKQFSIQGINKRSKGYLHQNTIWRYWCPDPEKMIEFILHQEELAQLFLF